MIKISATKLRNNLFEYLDRVERGETIVILRNKQEAARLAPIQPSDWRELVNAQPGLLVSPENIIAPLEKIGEKIGEKTGEKIEEGAS